MSYKKYWISLIAVMVIAFGVLLYFGNEIFHKAPPIPTSVVTTEGVVIFTENDIKEGQRIWQTIGGHELGTIWGHGSYVAPDWTAEWLHKEARFILENWALNQFHQKYDLLNKQQQAVLTARLQENIRNNTYNITDGTVKISPDRAAAINNNILYYQGLFTNDAKYSDLRNKYSVKENTLTDIEKVRKMSAFFFWTAWAAVTNRPNDDITYTNNWPPEDLVANRPDGSLIIWTGFSVIMLIAGIGFMSFIYARTKKEEEIIFPEENPLINLKAFPSMKATIKYFWVVALLLVLQVIFGIITAHYGVEGNYFYSLPLASILPYSITRTFHVQIGIFWIATSWLATGLFIAPAISGKDPKFQRFGVNFLFIALLLIVFGSLIGEWFAIMQKLGLDINFWFGHQGYEYVDLGRFWQIFLFVGLIIWVVLMVRALMPAYKKAVETKTLLSMFLLAVVAIALFYGAGLMWGKNTSLVVVEYWRWWVVHLWVEGFFEVFSTVVLAFLFTRLGLLGIKTATTGVMFTTIVYLAGGIIGTFHHLYFTGTPTSVLALGASFSALEVVPLVFMGYEAYHHWNMSKSTPWIDAYRWPIYFFISVAFWNLVGAGIFGFVINPPIALYYMQGLNTTPVHGHTALFGVYGMLGIGLMLFTLRTYNPTAVWNTKLVKFAFWTINIGLALMVLISLLPVGLMQTYASVKYGMWYARSAEFLSDPTVATFKWLRVFGDTIFAFGAVALFLFVIGLKTGWSLKKNK